MNNLSPCIFVTKQLTRATWIKLFLFVIGLFTSGGIKAQQTIKVTISSEGVVTKSDNINSDSLIESILHPVIWQGYSKPTISTRKSATEVITLSVYSTGSTCGSSNGSASIVPSGGVAPYTYEWVGMYTQNNGFFPQIGAGTHTFIIRDAAGNEAETSITIPNTYTRPSVNISSVTKPSDCTQQDGSLTLTASGGTPPYTYSIDAVNYQSSNTFNNLTAGFFYVFVRDANGCGASNQYPFNGLTCNSESVGLVFTQYACGNSGNIYIDLSRGKNGPYEYSSDGINYNTTGTLENIPPGIQTIYIKDKNGQILLYSVVLYPSCGPRVTANTTDAGCGQHDGIVTLTTTGGQAPYTYTIDGVSFQSSGTFTNLLPGMYRFGVKDADDVIVFYTVYVYENCPEVSTSVSAENCGQSDGSITVSVNRGVAPYEYSLNGVSFGTTNVFDHLSAGSYTVSVKDASGATVEQEIEVPTSCLTMSVTTIDDKCGNNNGKITIQASGGTLPYSYSLDNTNFQSGNEFSNLSAGTYTLVVRDGTGLTINDPATITNIPGPSISLSITPAGCSLTDGIIEINPTGGTAPFLYSIDATTYQSTNIFKNLEADNLYKATIKDANGCLATENASTGRICLIATGTMTNETCSQQNGTITVNASGGIEPYEYSIDGINFNKSNLFIGLAANDYTITVRDVDGRTSKTGISIQNDCPSVTAIAKNETCSAGNGSVTASGSNGTAPYLYSIDGINFREDYTFSALSAGTYLITIQDANGLLNTTQATILNFPAPSLSADIQNASCDDNDGALTLAGSSSIANSPWLFKVNDGDYQSSGLFEHLASGAYIATLKDVNGCTVSKAVDIKVDNTLTLDAGPDITLCEGSQKLLSASSNGLSFTWSPGSGLTDPNILNPTATPVATTTYQLSAFYGPCQATDFVTVKVDAAPTADAGQPVTICYGQNARLTGTGGVYYEWSPVTYLSDPTIAEPEVIKPGQSIAYTLSVKGINGCTSITPASVTVNVTPPPQIDAGTDTIIARNQPLPLSARDVNNSGFIQYTWYPSSGLNNPFSQSPIASPGKTTTYTVTGVTAAGCEGSGQINVKVYTGPDIYVPNAFTPNGNNHNDILKPITVGIQTFHYFVIYNRWGQRVFYSSNSQQGWNGSINREQIAMGTFVWMAEGVDYQGKLIQRKGTVTLIR